MRQVPGSSSRMTEVKAGAPVGERGRGPSGDHVDQLEGSDPDSSQESRANNVRRQSGFAFDVVRHAVPWAVLVVDEHGRLLFANQRARLVLTHGQGLEVRAGKLHV